MAIALGFGEKKGDDEDFQRTSGDRLGFKLFEVFIRPLIRSGMPVLGGMSCLRLSRRKAGTEGGTLFIAFEIFF